jgi:DNA-binding NtrC family response regulator
MKKPAILVGEQDDGSRRSLKDLLLLHGYGVIEASNVTDVFRAFRQKQRPDLLILSASLDGAGGGVEVARQIRQWNQHLPLLLTTTNGSEELAIAALRVGVNDYLKQPCLPEELLASIDRCLASGSSCKSATQQNPVAGSTKPVTDSGLIDAQGMIGRSPVMQEVKAYLARVAAADSSVLITGETGTGKELVAAFIHQHSRRQQRPFVSVNCAAIPDSLLESELFGYTRGAFTGASASQEGKMQSANGGTIFFDEIGDMSPYAQAKILRAIETREVQPLGAKKSVPVDVRVVAATNQDLEQLTSENKFRKDLYFRLNVARIHLPPLRDRKEDIPALFNHYIQEFNQRFGREVEGFTEEALAYLLCYEWPGNVRELKNLLEAIFVNLPPRQVSFLDLPEQFRKRLRDTEGLPQDERDRLLSALFATNWNMSKAAQKLHWSRMTLYRKMEKYHIVRGESGAERTTAAT